MTTQSDLPSERRQVPAPAPGVPAAASRSGHLAVVVVTYNSAPLLPELVESLRTGLAAMSWHLVVADNDSRDDTLDVLARVAPEATVVRMGRNAGYAAGINAAVTAAAEAGATGPTLILNPDVRVEPACVPELLRALESGAGIAVPRLVDGAGDLVLSMRRAPTVLRALADAVLGTQRAGRHALLGEIVTDPACYDRATTTDWAEGSTQLVREDCLDACGPWDEGFFLYSEETDFHLRARDAGYLVRYVPTARAVHLGGDSLTSTALWSLLVANRIKLFAQRRRPVAVATYWLVVLGRECSRALLGRKTSRRAVRTLVDPRRLRAPRGPEWAA